MGRDGEEASRKGDHTGQGVKGSAATYLAHGAKRALWAEEQLEPGGKDGKLLWA